MEQVMKLPVSIVPAHR